MSKSVKDLLTEAYEVICESETKENWKSGVVGAANILARVLSTLDVRENLEVVLEQLERLQYEKTLNEYQREELSKARDLVFKSLKKLDSPVESRISIEHLKYS